MGLKEITLSPDEDPAEALMRYNAASIREALERASQVPLEIGGDEYAEDLPQEPVDAEQLQHDPHQHQHHHHQYHHQYHHQDFVRLTTAAPPPSNTTEASVTSEATPTSTTTSTTTTTVSPPTETETLDEAEMQQDSAASETLRVAEAMSQQKEEIHELHKAVHALKLQLLDANRRCKKIQEQLKVNLVKEPEQEEELEKEPKEEKEKKPITEEEPKAKVQEQTRELEKEPEKPKALKDKSDTENQAKEEKQQEQEEGDDQEEDTECTGTSTTTTETPVTPSPPPPPPPSPPSQRSQEANAIAKVDRQLGTASAVASASIDANKLGYEEEEGNWQRILANRGYDTDYLTKSHERQYAEGGNLELPKVSPYDAPLSQEYSSYPEFQADEPAPDSDSEVKAKRAAAPLSVKLRAHMLNVALNGGGRRDASTAPTPYALRGKFMRRRSTAGSSAGRKKNSRISQISQEEIEIPSDEGWVRSTRQAKMPQRPQKKVTPLARKVTPKKKEASSARVTTQASVSSTNLDRLVDVLNDLLRLQLQKERRSSALKSNASLKSNNVLAKTSASSKLVKRKRLRKRQQPAPSSTIRSHIGM
ncbi:defective chorion protein, FC177 isoform-like [Drosophila kikkawai]|uniref:Defective chorion protein, FC177 isoform-like n=1 Tax=Drosophila kikkawai TaxID=30033 RepID=A0ABM4GP14_DROKI